MLYLNSVFTASSAFGSSLNVILPISLTSSVSLRLIRHNTLSSAFPTFPSRLSAVIVLFPYTTPPDVYEASAAHSFTDNSPLSVSTVAEMNLLISTSSGILKNTWLYCLGNVTLSFPFSATVFSAPHNAKISSFGASYVNSVLSDVSPSSAVSCFGSSLNVILPISLTSSVSLRLIRHNTLSSAFPTFPSRLSAVIVLFPYTTPPDVYEASAAHSFTDNSPLSVSTVAEMNLLISTSSGILKNT